MPLLATLTHPIILFLRAVEVSEQLSPVHRVGEAWNQGERRSLQVCRPVSGRGELGEIRAGSNSNVKHLTVGSESAQHTFTHPTIEIIYQWDILRARWVEFRYKGSNANGAATFGSPESPIHYRVYVRTARVLIGTFQGRVRVERRRRRLDEHGTGGWENRPNQRKS